MTKIEIIEIPYGISYQLGNHCYGPQGKHVMKDVYLVREVKNIEILHGRKDKNDWYGSTRRGYNGQVIEGMKKAVAAMNSTIKADIKKGKFN